MKPRHAWIILLSLLTGCQKLLGFEDFEGATGQGAAGSSGTAGDNAGGASGQGGDAGSGGEGGKPTCPRPDTFLDQRAMSSIFRGDAPCFWIDQREVSRADYQAFLDDTKSTPLRAYDGELQAICGSYTPHPLGAACDAKALANIKADTLEKKAQGPRTCVNWCDAAAYCWWTGKQLCRGTPSAKDPSKSAWYAACSDQNHDFSNSQSGYVKGLCRDNGSGDVNCMEPGACPMGLVQENTDCSTPDGVMNLSGNAVEWTWECGSSSSVSEQCAVRGGDAESMSFETSCASNYNLARNADPMPYLGFRCCYQP